MFSTECKQLSNFLSNYVKIHFQTVEMFKMQLYKLYKLYLNL